MLFFEMYRANVPLLAPSYQFLLKLQFKYGIVRERISISGHRRRHNPDDPFTHDTDMFLYSDPNDAEDRETVAYWLQFCEIYDHENFPHVIHFNSWDEMTELLITTDFDEVSRRMARFNDMVEEKTVSWWMNAIQRSLQIQGEKSPLPQDYDTAMHQLYGFNTTTNSC